MGKKNYLNETTVPVFGLRHSFPKTNSVIALSVASLLDSATFIPKHYMMSLFHCLLGTPFLSFPNSFPSLTIFHI